MPQSDGKNTLKRMEFEFKGKSFLFNLNPEEYVQEEPQRSTVTQTKGGAWIDDFGSGLTTIFLKGSTGMKNGFDKFKELRGLIREYKNNITPGDKVTDELVFHNHTDEESWVVHLDPSGFKLFRSKSNPLMFMYEIRLICLRLAQQPDKVADNGVKAKETTAGNVKAANTTAKSLDVQNGLVPTQFSTYVNSLKIMNNGSVQIIDTAPQLGSLTFFSENTKSAEESIEPIMSPYVSSLSLDYYRKFLSGGQGEISNRPVSSDSFLHKIIYEVPNAMLTVVESDLMRMIILECYAIYKTFTYNRDSFSSRVGQDDLQRLVQNIRYLTYLLENYDEEVTYDLVDGFRELELCIHSFRNSDSLFTRDVSKSIKDYDEAGVDVDE